MIAHYNPLDVLRPQLEALGLPPIVPEPEVIQRDLARIRCKSLARIIAGLLNDSEPLLAASADGPSVTVRVKGESETMRFTISDTREEMKG
jgi:hypothetical protein